MKFSELNIDEKLIQALQKQNIKNPTNIQEKVYEDILSHKDVVAESETGSGKTLAYLLPLFEKYKDQDKTNCVIIVVPTQELAMQVHKQIELLAQNSSYPMKSVPLFANVNIERQAQRLKVKPQFIVGTAGRIEELIKKKKINGQTVKTIVLDEADKLLDKKNIEGVKAVIKCTMKDRQLIFFSASMSPKSIEEAKAIAKEPKMVKKQANQTIPKEIKHMYLVVDKRDKFETLRKLARIMKPKKAMVFVNGKFEIEEATQKLKFHEFKAECIYGETDKVNRQKAVEGFAAGKINYLVATDLAARGLHFEGVDAVFHISIPEDPMDYLHRAGRTGRNGMSGVSVLIVTKEELERVKTYQKKFGVNILGKKMYQGKLVAR